MKAPVFLALFLLSLLCLSSERTDRLRAGFVGALAPSWQQMGRNTLQKQSPLRQLQLENQQLKQEIEQLLSLLRHEQLREENLKTALSLKETPSSEFVQRRLSHLTERIQRQFRCLPARIIFKENSPWSSGVWINVGEEDNLLLGVALVKKGSPVLSGRVLVGLVEQVEARRSLVRFVTDGTIAPSVRAVRGKEQNTELAKQLETLQRLLDLRQDLDFAPVLQTQLRAACSLLNRDASSLFLAKGTLQGSVQSKWRQRTARLKGVGFNYDFPDSEGEARQLRTGAFKDGSSPVPLIKVGDLLVTTGMDGIFPPDLPVATVADILPLREGGCAYEIEAESLLSDFDSLIDLSVLPPYSPS